MTDDKGNEIDIKDENNLELSWGYWYANGDYAKALLPKEKENRQLELFEGEIK